MNKEQVLTLYDYYSREIKTLLNPMGANKPSAVASKIAGVIKDLQRSGAGSQINPADVKELIDEKILKYRDGIFVSWCSDLKTMYEEDTDEIIYKVINFYIQRAGLTKEESEFYKEVQRLDSK